MRKPFFKVPAVIFTVLAVVCITSSGRGQKSQDGGAADATGRFSGSWSVSHSSNGIHGSGNGSVSFSVNLTAGTFTCNFSGKIEASGSNLPVDGGTASITADTSMSSNSCKGTYDSASGALSGSMTASHSGKMYMTITGKGEDGEDSAKTTSQPVTGTSNGPISGNIYTDSGYGTWTDDEGAAYNWKVTGSFSGVEGDTASGDSSLGPCDKEPESDTCINYLSGMDDKKIDKLFTDLKTDDLEKFFSKMGKDILDMLPVDALSSALDDMKPGPGTDKAIDELCQKLFAEQPEQPTQQNVDKSDLKNFTKDVKDLNVKKSVIKDFVDNKIKNNDKVISAGERKLQEAKERTEFNEELDKSANYLGDKVDEKITQAKAAVIDKMVEVSWGWANEGAGSNHVKDSLNRIQEKTKNISASNGVEIADKVKKAGDTIKEIVAVKKKIDSINQKVKNGEITEGRGKALKGGTLLGKALKYATSWIPGFGESASEITDKTFGAALRVGEKKAERATSLEKCQEDPLSDQCMNDIDNGIITGY